MTQESLPERIGHYRVLGRLGAGGMGEVLLAEDTKLERRVAIKRPKLETAYDDCARRLLTEARAVARLDHPNICGIYEVGEDASGPYIVMPVVEGETLAAVLARGPLPFAEAAGIGAQIADALAAAHGAGILHRDIKPGNVIVGARKQVRVMDFGLAKLAPAADATESMRQTASFATAAGVALGTIAYMSPEQARGERTDARSDLFSLGVLLYESIAGRHPFAAPSVTETLTAIQTQDPPPLARFRSEVPESLQRIIAKLLKRSPLERYQSAADAAVDLRTGARELGGDAAPSSAAGAQPKAAPRRLWLVPAVAVGVVALAVAAGVFLWQQSSAPPQALVSGRPSIAVLPFLNRSPDSSAPDADYIVDGITESVIRNLAGLPNLKVISRNTVFRFKNQLADARKIASDLGVAAVMTGTVSRLGNQIAVDVEMSNVADDTVLFSQRYLHDAMDVMKFEAAIAQDAASHLHMALTGDDQQRMRTEPTSSKEAYQLFLRGRFHLNQLTPAALHQAIDYFKSAVALDASYGLAWSEMAAAYLLLGIYFEAPDGTMTVARTTAMRALEVSPQLRDPRIVLAMIHLLYDWDYPAAAKAMLSAGRVDSGALGILGCTAHLLETSGQLTDAERQIREALESDPLSIPLNTELGCGAYYRRQYDDAIRSYNEALKLEPRNDVAYWGLGRAYGQKQMWKEALAALGRSQSVNGIQPPIILAELGYVYARTGRTAEARRIVGEMTAPGYPVFVDPYLVAIVYAGLGDKDAALQSLAKACDIHSSFITSIAVEPKWDVLKDDPRFDELTKRVQLLGGRTA